MVDWDVFLKRLRAHPPHFHRILPPCPGERIAAVEKRFGKLPTSLKAMLKHFNGAELFMSVGATFTMFGLSTIPPFSAAEWAPDWYLDAFTAKWRAAGSSRQDDWAVAMTNYGGLMLLDSDETIKEWDTGQSRWLVAKLPITDWLDSMISEGEVIMCEA